MKKSIIAIAILVGLVSVMTASKRLQAGGLQTRIFSDNHTYSTTSTNQISNLRIAMLPTASNPNSNIEILLAAVAPTATASDGLADFNAFDIGNISVTCPQSVPGVFDFGTPVITTAEFSHVEISGIPYHKIVCPYTGSGDVTQADFGFGNDNYLIIRDLINPRSDPDQPQTQLIYSPIWITFSSAMAQMTITSGHNVQMLATIVPQLSLRIDGLPAGKNYCGITNAQTTTGKLADFGDVANEEFVDIAQRLTATTNLPGGYVVTAIQDDQMRRRDEPDTVCLGDGSQNDACVPNSTTPGISPTKSIKWTSPSTGRGLAFTIQNDYGSDEVFDYTAGYRTFADAQNSEEPVAIMKSPNGRRGVDYICYRIVAAEDNRPGYYANNITYTLTARF